jgi:hypothetical protein
MLSILNLINGHSYIAIERSLACLRRIVLSIDGGDNNQPTAAALSVSHQTKHLG